jgi:hypothetical protein
MLEPASVRPRRMIDVTPRRRSAFPRMMRKTCSIARKMLSIILAGVFSLTVAANAADLKPETIAAYKHYLQITEANVDAELARGDPYLWIDSVPASRRAGEYAELRKGNLVIERLETLDHGKTIPVPGGWFTIGSELYLFRARLWRKRWGSWRITITNRIIFARTSSAPKFSGTMATIFWSTCASTKRK